MSCVSQPHKLHICNTIDDFRLPNEISENQQDARKAAHESEKSSSLSLVNINCKWVKK